jgi:hypothetical protein
VSTYALNPTKLEARGVPHPLGWRDIFWNVSAIVLFNQVIQGRFLVFSVNKTQLSNFGSFISGINTCLEIEGNQIHRNKGAIFILNYLPYRFSVARLSSAFVKAWACIHMQKVDTF